MLDFNKMNSQFDINNIDPAQITKLLLEHQTSIIKVALIIGSLFMGWSMYNDHRAKDQDLHAQISQMQDKLDAIKTHNAATQDLNSFKSSLPKKLNEFELITLISDYAKLYHVSIPSLSPAESRDMGLYDIINLNFSAVSDNFKNMMLFLRKIEKSDYPLRIDSWSGNEKEDGNGEINFVIKISAVLLHT